MKIVGDDQNWSEMFGNSQNNRDQLELTENGLEWMEIIGSLSEVVVM